MTTTPEQSSSLPATSSSRQKNPQDGRNTRTVISCFSCRHKKLKCDRARPSCSCCVKRDLSCAYATPTERPPAQKRGGNTHLYGRIRHLEDLIATLVTERTGTSDTTSSQPVPSSNNSLSSSNSPKDVNETTKNNTSISQSDSGEEYVQEFGHMRMSDSEITYISATHWKSIRDNITSIREYIETGDGQYDPAQAIYEGPSLLLGICTPSSIVDILSSIPSRSTVDRLVSRYFNSGDPSVNIFHVPTFQHEYDRFWADPQATPVTWTSMLFSIMCLGLAFHLRSGEDQPNMSCPPREAARLFRLRAVECLALGNYTKPKAYTIESLLLHTQTEYFGSENPETGIWLLWGMVVRLAMFIGLHRDSTHFPEISCFEGEMRRRRWALITQLDLLISYQAGMPRMVREGEGDTELPHNLLDEDFDKSSTELPASRSDREATPVSYCICKGKLTHIFGLILDRASSIKQASTETLIELDQKLIVAYSSIPPHLKLRGSVTDPPALIMRRYTLDILYHKACCLLHRVYVNISPANPQYHPSRTRCLDSATRLLGHHATINQETQPGGMLSRDKWFASSLMSSDFQLAAMIICLELQRREKRNDDMETHSKEELLRLLEISHDLWSSSASYSEDAAKAAEALAFMLRKVKNTTVVVDNANIYSAVPTLEMAGMASMATMAGSEDEQTATATKQNSRPMDLGSNGDQWLPIDQQGMFPSVPTMNTAFSTPAAGNPHTDGADIMADINLSTDIDWRLWDSQIQNIGIHPDWMDGQEF